MSNGTERGWHVFGSLPEGMEEPLDEGQIEALMERDILSGDDVVRRTDSEEWVEIRESDIFQGGGGASGSGSQQQRQQRQRQQKQGTSRQSRQTGQTGGSTQQRQGQQQHQKQPQRQRQSRRRDGGASQADRPDASEESEAVFKQLVKGSWDRYKKRERATEVDEVLVGAVITSTLENGYSLIDLDSDGQNHYLRFEDMDTGDRTIFELNHRAESLTTAEIIGHEASVNIGYGERVRDFSSVWKALKQEMKGGYIQQPDPGIITVDGDMSSQYIYVQVRMIWDINDYLQDDDPYSVRYGKMTRHIGSTIDVLHEYLEGRLNQTTDG